METGNSLPFHISCGCIGEVMEDQGQNCVDAPSGMPLRPKDFTLHLVHISAHGLGNAGLGFIGYGTVVSFTDKPWPWIEPFLRPIAASLVLIGLAITVVSVYLPWAPDEPLPVSKVFTAPVALTLILGYAVMEVTLGLRDSIINGFALLTISGAIFRMFPRPNMKASPD